MQSEVQVGYLHRFVQVLGRMAQVSPCLGSVCLCFCSRENAGDDSVSVSLCRFFPHGAGFMAGIETAQDETHHGAGH